MSEDQVNAADPAEPDAPQEPEPSAVHKAVTDAIAQTQEENKVELSACPCMKHDPAEIVVESQQGTKVGHAICSHCGVWGVEFLIPRTQDQNVLARAAAKAWNDAPRIGS